MLLYLVVCAILLYTCSTDSSLNNPETKAYLTSGDDVINDFTIRQRTKRAVGSLIAALLRSATLISKSKTAEKYVKIGGDTEAMSDLKSIIPYPGHFFNEPGLIGRLNNNIVYLDRSGTHPILNIFSTSEKGKVLEPKKSIQYISNQD